MEILPEDRKARKYRAKNQAKICAAVDNKEKAFTDFHGVPWTICGAPARKQRGSQAERNKKSTCFQVLFFTRFGIRLGREGSVASV